MRHDPHVLEAITSAAAHSPGATADPRRAATAWSLAAYLGLWLALRAPAVVFADGFEFLDQQYQYVDPAWHFATGGAWHRPWEWIDGVRSEVYPRALAAVFAALRWFGCDDSLVTMRLVRAVHALASLLPAWLFWLAAVRWRSVASPRAALALFAIAGIVVGSGVQPSGPALAVSLAVGAALAVQGPRLFPLLGGLCLGLAFCCRFQEALFGPAMLAVLAWQRRFAAASLLIVGCLPGVVLQGLTDLRTHGVFLATAWSYLDTNLVGGAASKWRGQPWWFYAVAGVLPTLALVPPFVHIAWRRFVAGARLLPAAAAAGSFHLLLHSFVARKALRFEFGALAMLLAVVAVGVASAPTAGRERSARWHSRTLFAVHAAWWLYVSLWFGNAGAVRMAIALRGDPALGERILVVDGDATSLGGFYYLRPPADRVEGLPLKDGRRDTEALAARFATSPPPRNGLVIAVREPLDAAALGVAGRLQPVATFTGMFDLRRGERRYVYRWL